MSNKFLEELHPQGDAALLYFVTTKNRIMES
jgi:hypothetical protein